MANLTPEQKNMIDHFFQKLRKTFPNLSEQEALKIVMVQLIRIAYLPPDIIKRSPSLNI